MAIVAPDYLIGHLCRDVIAGGTRTGGTVFYAGIMAATLGRRVAIVTAFADQLPSALERIQVALAPSTTTTTFEHSVTPGGRALRLLERGPTISAAAIPGAWLQASLVHLAPIVHEVPADFLGMFPDSQVVATPQGWLGRERTEGKMTQLASPAWLVDPRFSALVLAIEDLEGDWSAAEALAARAPTVVVTDGAAGYALYVDGHGQLRPSFPGRDVDATGAGDVFSAAFFVRLSETRDPEVSARFAAAAGALFAWSAGASRFPTRPEIAAQLEADSAS